MKLIRLLLLIAIAGAPVSSPLAEQMTSNVLLAQVYQRGIDVRQFLVSEKFDGVRAVWDGKTFHTRSGRVITAPAWFTQGFPVTPLDGELWLARGKFEALSGAVRKNVPVDEEWRGISYLVFELPNAQGAFQVRAQRIVEIVKRANTPHLKAVEQFRVKDEAALNARLKQVVALGGEGLMLHRADAPYITGRSDTLLKLKLQNDAEATVVAHTPGRGKYRGKLGALVVETPEGIRFKLGTGLSDDQREDPPKIGSLVTYTYRDKTASGKPRFASFLRVRHE
ncbi:MAG: DNA ligase [Methylotenera sp.]|nr:DNA ligase [Methylotenera sp.]